MKKDNNSKTTAKASGNRDPHEIEVAAVDQMDYEPTQNNAKVNVLTTREVRRGSKTEAHKSFSATVRGIEDVAIVDHEPEVTESVAVGVSSHQLGGLSQVGGRLSTIRADLSQLGAEINTEEARWASTESSIAIIEKGLARFQTQLLEGVAAVERYKELHEEAKEKGFELREAHQRLQTEFKSMQSYVDTLMGVTRDDSEDEPIVEPIQATKITKPKAKKNSKKVSEKGEEEPKVNPPRPSREERASKRAAQSEA